MGGGPAAAAAGGGGSCWGVAKPSGALTSRVRSRCCTRRQAYRPPGLRCRERAEPQPPGAAASPSSSRDSMLPFRFLRFRRPAGRRGPCCPAASCCRLARCSCASSAVAGAAQRQPNMREWAIATSCSASRHARPAAACFPRAALRPLQRCTTCTPGLSAASTVPECPWQATFLLNTMPRVSRKPCCSARVAAGAVAICSGTALLGGKLLCGITDDTW